MNRRWFLVALLPVASVAVGRAQTPADAPANRENIEAALFLEHLRDSRGAGVAQRARLHGGDAVGLRGCAAGTERQKQHAAPDGRHHFPIEHWLSSLRAGVFLVRVLSDLTQLQKQGEAGSIA